MIIATIVKKVNSDPRRKAYAFWFGVECHPSACSLNTRGSNVHLLHVPNDPLVANDLTAHSRWFGAGIEI